MLLLLDEPLRLEEPLDDEEARMPLSRFSSEVLLLRCEPEEELRLSRCEPDEDALWLSRCEPDDDPLWLSRCEPDDEALRPALEPSPCDELLRSRFESLDEPLMPLSVFEREPDPVFELFF